MHWIENSSCKILPEKNSQWLLLHFSKKKRKKKCVTIQQFSLT